MRTIFNVLFLWVISVLDYSMVTFLCFRHIIRLLFMYFIVSSIWILLCLGLKKKLYPIGHVYYTLLLHLESSHNASNQLLSHLFSKRGVLITVIWTTIGLSLIYALLLRYWKNLSYLKFLPTSTLTIFTILVNQHIVQVTELKQLFWKLLMICSFLLTKATYLY